MVAGTHSHSFPCFAHSTSLVAQTLQCVRAESQQRSLVSARRCECVSCESCERHQVVVGLCALLSTTKGGRAHAQVGGRTTGGHEGVGGCAAEEGLLCLLCLRVVILLILFFILLLLSIFDVAFQHPRIGLREGTAAATTTLVNNSIAHPHQCLTSLAIHLESRQFAHVYIHISRNYQLQSASRASVRTFASSSRTQMGAPAKWPWPWQALQAAFDQGNFTAVLSQSAAVLEASPAFTAARVLQVESLIRQSSPVYS